MRKKVLITGASGFVGFHLIEHCLHAGYEVYAAIRAHSNTLHLEGRDISFVDLNYTDVDRLRIQLQTYKFDYIIHAAGSTKAKTKTDYNRVNAEYTRNLALAVSTANFRITKFVFVSSLAALGPLQDLTQELQGDSVAHPVTNYGKSKLLAEQYLSEIANLPLLTIRPTAVYGPREKDLFILFKTIDSGFEPYIGKFKQQLSFIYVKDLARVIVDALESELEGKTYNISDGKIYDRYALAIYIKKALVKRTLKFHLPVTAVAALAGLMDLFYTRSGTTPTLNKEKMAELTAVNWACGIEDAQKDLNFTPEFDLESGLGETVKWYKENNWL